MHSQEIRTALGKLQAEPDAEDAWSTLQKAVGSANGDMSREEFARLADAACDEHARRGEWEAVSRLLEIASVVAQGTPREADLSMAQARVLSDELFDEDGAAICYLKVLDLRPSDPQATAALGESEGKRQRRDELVQGYLEEAETAPDDVYKSSMLMRASEMEVRFGDSSANREQTIDRLEQAVRLDPSNVRAGRLLEHLYRHDGRWEELAHVLERLADRGEALDERVGAGVRLARVYSKHLSDPERAARAFDRVLREDPRHAEAKQFLSELYAAEERWADMVSLYERELASSHLPDGERLGDMLQIGMLYWKKLGRAPDADPWFERVRKVDPANEVMLGFCREYYATLDDDTRLIEVLQNAQRVMRSNPPEKIKLAHEIARLAEGQANAQTAIEQYKSLLRQDPDNVESRERLKTLYKQTQGYNSLVELLRAQLDRAPADDLAQRLEILREVATVYREYQRSDAALLSVLSQIVQLDDKLDEHDVVELREIVQLYEKMGRHRELIAHQQKLAEVTPDRDEKKELYRQAARRWLDQFSNVQNATEAYAKLIEVDPTDREARERLDELYRKRRAWGNLYALYESELPTTEGTRRVALLREMAQLAQERLNRPEDAVRLYREVLSVDPSRTDVLDALEKHAERTKDWATLAEALERRVEIATDPAVKLTALQRLGAVYGEQLRDTPGAVRAWRRVLELQPGHSRALRVLRDAYLAGGDYDGLEQLYALEDGWEALAEVLSTAADRANDTRARIDLSYRAARVLEERLNQPERAFRSYERVLTTDPTDARAARALIPLYEREEKWSRLPALYSLLLERAESTEEKLELLGRLVEITGKRLGDKRAAAAHARKAYELEPNSELALSLFEDTSRAAGAWEVFVEVLAARVAAAPSVDETPPPPDAAERSAEGGRREHAEEPERKRGKKKKRERAAEAPGSGDRAAPALALRSLELKLGRVYAEELARTDDAIAVYKRVLTRDPLDAEAAQSLEAILRRDDRRDDLRWLLELRIENANDSEKVRLLGDFATLEEDVFDSPALAAILYRRILDLDGGDRSALLALPRLLKEAGDAAGAAEIVARHRDQLSGEERAAREVELAELYLERLERPEAALASAVAALDSPSVSGRATAVLEALVRVPSVRAEAARTLAERYGSEGDARKEVNALEVMLEEAPGNQARAALFERLADAYEQRLASYGNALDVMFKAVREFPNDLRFWDRADDLAARAGRPTDLSDAYREVLRGELARDLEVELAERAARLHEDRLGDPIGATPYLERVLALAPGNEAAFRRLKDILTAAERWSELEALYDRASVATEDANRRIEMLVEVALICEEIIEDAVKATEYYERIVAIDPFHEGANRALDRLYVQQGKDKKLSALLERRLETALGDELFELKLRLAKLDLELLEPEAAVVHVEDVLRERVNDYEARAFAERLLEIGTLRARAARMLETVYEARDEVRDLVRVLEIRLEGLTGNDSDRRELLRRVATLRDGRLHDDQGAFDAFARLVPLDPLDIQARSGLLELGRRLAAHERVATVLAEAAGNADTSGLRSEILMQVASIYEEAVGDHKRAEQVYRQVLDIDRDQSEFALPAARALEHIYATSGNAAKLVEMLRVQVRLEQDGATRVALLARVGELCERDLDDAASAIVAWKQLLEEQPDQDAALLALDRLYVKTGSHREAVGIMQRRSEVTVDGELRKSLLVRIGETLWKKLEAVSEAIDAYRTLIGEFGPEDSTLSALEALFTSAERWEDLAETYEQHVDIARTDAERLELFAKLGDLKREHLGDISGALEVYRRGVAIDAGHGASRAALERVLESSDPIARREAAQVLRPILEADRAHEQLLRVLEIEIETAEDAPEKLGGLEAALAVAEGPLADVGRAFEYVRRAIRTAAGHSALEPWIERLDRLAKLTGRQREHVELLSEIVPSIFDGEVQLSATLKIADLGRNELGDAKLAREYYQKALELRSDDRRALSALENLYEEGGDAQSLLGILQRRVDASESDEEKRRLMFRQARLLADTLKDNTQAIDAYESILELGSEPEAYRALEGLYAAVGRWSDLISLYERQLTAGLGAAGDLHVSMGRVAAQHQNDFGRAFEEFEAALGTDRLHAGAIAELERLLAEGSPVETRARAAALLEPVYTIRADFGPLMGAIQAHLETAADPAERRELLVRLANLHEEQKEDYRAALETMAKLLHEDIADQGTVGELERLAKVAGAEERLAEIYAEELADAPVEDDNGAHLARRTGQLFDGLGRADRALEFYRRALAFEPDSRPLFEGIDAILKRLDRHEERVGLYRTALEQRFEPKERSAALHTIAELERGPLGRPDAAIETYREAIEADEGDVRAQEALTELYRGRERWDDLGELYLHRAESALDPAGAADHRLELARLHLQLGQRDRALDQLEEIVRVLPAHADAIAALEALRSDSGLRRRVVDILRPLFESSDEWRRQISLNQDRLGLSESEAEKIAVLRETAELWEARGDDLDRAFLALEAALRIDPDDGEVRLEYERIAGLIGTWDQLAQAYEEVLAQHPRMVSQRDVLAVLAEVHDQRRDDPRRALEAYERLFKTDESEIAPLEKMDQLATLLSDWQALVRVLTAKAELLTDDEERASAWRRIGEAKRDMLDDREGAIVAYERAWELDPESAFTLDCLIELYEAKDDARRLVELYQRRVDLTDAEDSDQKYALLSAAAKRYEETLSDRPRAIEMLVQALDVRPSDETATRALNRLYRAEGLWPELLDSLRREAGEAKDAAARAALHVAIGDVLADQLTSFEEALGSYARALEDTPADAALLGKVRTLGEQQDDLRGPVADVLVPVLRQAERWDDLVSVLEMRLSVESDPDSKVKTLVAMAEVLEKRLARASAAEEALLRALAERPEAAELHAEIARLAQASGGWARYADALGERAASTFDPAVAKDLYVRLGRVAEEQLSDSARAVEAYGKAVEQAGDDLDLLTALVRLYDRLGDSIALADVLERSALVEVSAEKQADLYYRLGVLQNSAFQEPARALGSLRLVLERVPNHDAALSELEKLTDRRELFDEAADALEEVYRGRGLTDRLAKLYEKRVGFADSLDARLEMRQSLARVLEEEVKDPKAAQRVIEQGLVEVPEDAGLVDETERLAGITGEWAAAAEALGRAIEEHRELSPDTAIALATRLASWLRDRVKDNAGAERALEKALIFDPEDDQTLVLLQELQAAKGRERALLETLRRRAKLQQNDAEREELYKKAKALADELSDAAAAEAVLRELLAQDDTNLWALDALTSQREVAGDAQETFSLLVRQAELLTDPAAIRNLRWKAATIARDKLEQPTRATELFEQLFEDDPSDEQSAGALRAAYLASERYQDLGRLLERLIDVATSPQKRTELRLELAVLSAERFSDASGAIELLRAVLDEEPGQETAVVRLSELYEKARRDDDLADLLSTQIEGARRRGDVAAELAFQVRLGEICESRLGDRARAIETYRGVLERDPQHGGALEALARLLQSEGELEEAARILERLLEQAKGEQAVRRAVEVAALHRQLGSKAAALAALERGAAAGELTPELVTPLRALYQELERWDALAALYAREADRAKEPEEAVQLLRQAAAVHAEKRGDPATAAELLDRASRLKPGDRELLLELCERYSASGRGKEAAGVLEKIVESYGTKRPRELGEIHRRLAGAYLADGDAPKALVELDKAFRIEPGNIGVLVQLGDVAMRVGDHKKAQQMYRALLLQKLDEHGPIKKSMVFLRLGDIHDALGERPKAQQMYERAVQTDGSEEAKAKLQAYKG